MIDSQVDTLPSSEHEMIKSSVKKQSHAYHKTSLETVESSVLPENEELNTLVNNWLADENILKFKELFIDLEWLLGEVKNYKIEELRDNERNLSVQKDECVKQAENEEDRKEIEEGFDCILNIFEAVISLRKKEVMKEVVDSPYKNTPSLLEWGESESEKKKENESESKRCSLESKNVSPMKALCTPVEPFDSAKVVSPTLQPFFTPSQRFVIPNEKLDRPPRFSFEPIHTPTASQSASEGFSQRSQMKSKITLHISQSQSQHQLRLSQQVHLSQHIFTSQQKNLSQLPAVKSPLYQNEEEEEEKERQELKKRKQENKDEQEKEEERKKLLEKKKREEESKLEERRLKREAEEEDRRIFAKPIVQGEEEEEEEEEVEATLILRRTQEENKRANIFLNNLAPSPLPSLSFTPMPFNLTPALPNNSNDNNNNDNNSNNVNKGKIVVAETPVCSPISPSTAKQQHTKVVVCSVSPTPKNSGQEKRQEGKEGQEKRDEEKEEVKEEVEEVKEDEEEKKNEEQEDHVVVHEKGDSEDDFDVYNVATIQNTQDDTYVQDEDNEERRGEEEEKRPAVEEKREESVLETPSTPIIFTHSKHTDHRLLDSSKSRRVSSQLEVPRTDDKFSYASPFIVLSPSPIPNKPTQYRDEGEKEEDKEEEGERKEDVKRVGEGEVLELPLMPPVLNKSVSENKNKFVAPIKAIPNNNNINNDRHFLPLPSNKNKIVNESKAPVLKSVGVEEDEEDLDIPNTYQSTTNDDILKKRKLDRAKEMEREERERVEEEKKKERDKEREIYRNAELLEEEKKAQEEQEEKMKIIQQQKEEYERVLREEETDLEVSKANGDVQQEQEEEEMDVSFTSYQNDNNNNKNSNHKKINNSDNTNINERNNNNNKGDNNGVDREFDRNASFLNTQGAAGVLLNIHNVDQKKNEKKERVKEKGKGKGKVKGVEKEKIKENVVNKEEGEVSKGIKKKVKEKVKGVNKNEEECQSSDSDNFVISKGRKLSHIQEEDKEEEEEVDDNEEEEHKPVDNKVGKAMKVGKGVTVANDESLNSPSPKHNHKQNNAIKTRGKGKMENKEKENEIEVSEKKHSKKVVEFEELKDEKKKKKKGEKYVEKEEEGEEEKKKKSKRDMVIKDNDDIEEEDEENNENYKMKKKKNEKVIDKEEGEEEEDEEEVEDFVFKEHDHIEAMWKEGKSVEQGYYEGVIHRVNGDGTYFVKYQDGDKDMRVKGPFIRSKKVVYGVDDRVSGNWQKEGVWYPAIITHVNNNDNTYALLYDDGDKEEKVSSGYLKVLKKVISKSASPKVSSAPKIKVASSKSSHKASTRTKSPPPLNKSPLSVSKGNKRKRIEEEEEDGDDDDEEECGKLHKRSRREGDKGDREDVLSRKREKEELSRKRKRRDDEHDTSTMSSSSIITSNKNKIFQGLCFIITGLSGVRVMVEGEIERYGGTVLNDLNKLNLYINKTIFISQPGNYRTEKHLLAVLCDHPLVHYKWVTQSIKRGSLCDYLGFLLPWSFNPLIEELEWRNKDQDLDDQYSVPVFKQHHPKDACLEIKGKSFYVNFLLSNREDGKEEKDRRPAKGTFPMSHVLAIAGGFVVSKISKADFILYSSLLDVDIDLHDSPKLLSMECFANVILFPEQGGFKQSMADVKIDKASVKNSVLRNKIPSFKHNVLWIENDKEAHLSGITVDRMFYSVGEFFLLRDKAGGEIKEGGKVCKLVDVSESKGGLNLKWQQFNLHKTDFKQVKKESKKCFGDDASVIGEKLLVLDKETFQSLSYRDDSTVLWMASDVNKKQAVLASQQW